MILQTKSRNSLLIIFLFSLLLSSCSSEKRIAFKYITENTMQTILLQGPESIYKKDLDIRKLKSEGVSDSLIQVKQQILDSLNVESYVNRFMKSYISSLEGYGFKIILSTDSAALSNNSIDYVVNLAQIEFEEYSEEVREEIQPNEYVYTFDFTIENLFVNNWFEISSPSTENYGSHVLYVDNGITEDYFGRFVQNKGGVGFDLNKTPILSKDIYALGELLGKEYATYTFDFFFNQYVRMNSSKSNNDRKYYSFDHKVALIYATDKHFIELK